MSRRATEESIMEELIRKQANGETLNKKEAEQFITDYFKATGIIDMTEHVKAALTCRHFGFYLWSIEIGICNIGIAPNWKNKNEVLMRYAESDAPIMILGETGTGKELLAKVIHNLSNRKNELFTPINASAITESLFESEIFGHKKGSFTDALNEKIGQLQLTNKGTFFLDELGKMPKSLQAKLLRVLEDKEIRKVGAAEFEKIDVRFIVALQQTEIDEGKVLDDLLYRLRYPDVFRMPSLNDVLILSRGAIIYDISRRVMNKINFPWLKALTIDKELMDHLIGRKYKGNYREMKNILYHAIMHIDRDRDRIGDGDYQLSMLSIEELTDKESPSTITDRTYPTIKLSTVLSTEDRELEELFIKQPTISIALDYENIKLTNIISHTEKVGNLIIKGMAIYIHRHFGEFKKPILTEDPTIDYVNCLNKLERKIGMTATAYANKYIKNSVT